MWEMGLYETKLDNGACFLQFSWVLTPQFKSLPGPGEYETICLDYFSKLVLY